MSLEQKLYDENAYKGKVTSLLGTLPKGALKDAEVKDLNNTFSKGRYQDYVLDIDAAGEATDATNPLRQSRTQG